MTREPQKVAYGFKYMLNQLWHSILRYSHAHENPKKLSLLLPRVEPHNDSPAGSRIDKLIEGHDDLQLLQ